MKDEGIRGKKQEKAQAQPHEQGQEEVAKRSCSGNKEHITPVIAEIAGIDRYGLCPAEDERCEQAGKHEAAQSCRIDMRQWIEGEPAQHAGCGISALERHEAMGDLMKDDPKQKGEEDDDDLHEL